ncbi:hypothetical protein [Paenibacillus sp. 1P07SE]|uniref:hypothetical protein n=1 Tax=Paenibacillus sp. 1P07SE TaxID=3132209 RepID=UPI0039A6E880
MRKTSGMAKSSLVWLLVAALLFVAPVGAAANAEVIQANLYKAFHDTYDENDPDQKFSGALDLQFYNMELDIMVDANHSTYTGPQYPDYLQGKVRLYVKHDAAAQPNTRDLYQLSPRGLPLLQVVRLIGDCFFSPQNLLSFSPLRRYN